MFLVIIIVALAAIGAALFVVKGRVAPKLIVGDASWDGTFPCEAPAFIGPAYVYADGKETPNVRFGVPIVGYRAAPDLIVAVDFGFQVTASQALSLADKKNTRLPSSKDVKRLLEKWDEINALKVAVEDIPLSEAFWAMLDGMPEFYSRKTKTFILADKRLLSERHAEAILLIER